MTARSVGKAPPGLGLEGPRVKGRASGAKTGRLPVNTSRTCTARGRDHDHRHSGVGGGVNVGRAGRGAAEAGGRSIAPGGENGIGVPLPRGDNGRATVMATGPLSSEEFRARHAAAQEEAGSFAG